MRGAHLSPPFPTQSSDGRDAAARLVRPPVAHGSPCATHARWREQLRSHRVENDASPRSLTTAMTERGVNTRVACYYVGLIPRPPGTTHGGSVATFRPRQSAA